MRSACLGCLLLSILFVSVPRPAAADELVDALTGVPGLTVLSVVNGQNDPWSAEPFRLGPRTRDSFSYLVPGANHGARIAGLPIGQRDQAAAVIRRWASLAGATATTAPRVESLDSIYELETARMRKPK